MLAPRARGDQDVGGLDVAVDEPAPVRRAQRVGDLGDDRDRAGGLEPPLLGQQRPQVGALDVAHGEVERPALDAGVEDLDDVRMVERRGEPALALEARAEHPVAGQARRQQLERDLAGRG